MNGHQLSLTATHYIHVQHFQYLPAFQLTLEHSLYMMHNMTDVIRKDPFRSIKIEIE